MSDNSFCTTRCRDDWRIRSRHNAYPILFDRLDTWSDDLAYFLGLMLTDGNVIASGPVSFVSLDECSAQFVRDFIAPATPIRTETTKAGNIAYRWSVYSGSLVAALARFGLTPRKSLTVGLPPVPDAFLWDFVRGVLDGDGHIDQAGRATFSSGSERFATEFAGLLRSHGLTVSVRHKRRAFSIDLSVPSSRTLAGLMYRADCPHLARKRARFRLSPRVP